MLSLLSKYYLDVYGPILWYFSNQCTKTFYIALHKVIRKVCFLPYAAHCNLMSIIDNKHTVDLALGK